MSKIITTKQFCHSILLLATFIILITATPFSQATEITENHIKAAFLYNLSKFITWPNRNSPSKNDPIKYCSFGTDKTDKLLEATVNKKPPEKRVITFKRLNNVNDINKCDLLFIGNIGNNSLSSILKRINKKSIVTASNIKDFSNNGGMITLSQKNKRIHVIINIDTVHESNLKISSKVKRLSTIITNK